MKLYALLGRLKRSYMEATDTDGSSVKASDDVVTMADSKYKAQYAAAA